MKKSKPLKKQILVNIPADNGRKVRVHVQPDGDTVRVAKRYIVGVQLTTAPGPNLRLGRGAFVPALMTRAAVRELRDTLTRVLLGD